LCRIQTQNRFKRFSFKRFSFSEKEVTFKAFPPFYHQKVSCVKEIGEGSASCAGIVFFLWHLFGCGDSETGAWNVTVRGVKKDAFGF
jgi:hypothetical protein